MKRRKKKRYDSVDIVSFVCLTVLAILIVIPFWNAIVISFETESAYIKSPFSWLPGEFTLTNYEYMFEHAKGLITAYKNTIKIAVIGTVLGMAMMTAVAYCFSRQFPGKRVLFYIMLFTMFFGGGLVPKYLLIKNLGLLDTHAAIILMSLASVHNIIVMKNGFESIPNDLPEAAMIDGASDFTIFARVMLPLQKPMIATFSLFHVVGAWNNWYWPTLILNSSDKAVLQVFLRTLLANAGGTAIAESSMGNLSDNVYSMGIQMAAVFIVMLPIMLVYPFLQKYFVKGVLVGGVKM